MSTQGPGEPAPARDNRQALEETLSVRLATSTDTTADVLHALAADPRVTVRAAVALNQAAPSSADALLADDADERVRTLLARKLATLMPHANATDREGFRAEAMSTLATLVRDEALRVRSAIADVVKDMPHAPRGIILRLARDSAVQVSEPVIRLSPLLTPEDLLGLLAHPPIESVAATIAGRARLDEAVCDAIAATADNNAIAALLRNDSAAIREATLDALIARAVPIEAWHDPLVRRPRLSARAARALSEMVATHLLEVLVGRGDLDPILVAELRGRLDERLRQRAAAPRPVAPSAIERLSECYEHALVLARSGHLTENCISCAIRRGDAAACSAMLAVAADVSLGMIERACNLRNAKAIVSLAWSSRLSMQTAVQLQTLLGNIPPGNVIGPTQSGGFPLSVWEMRWQVGLLKDTERTQGAATAETVF